MVYTYEVIRPSPRRGSGRRIDKASAEKSNGPPKPPVALLRRKNHRHDRRRPRPVPPRDDALANALWLINHRRRGPLRGKQKISEKCSERGSQTVPSTVIATVGGASFSCCAIFSVSRVACVRRKRANPPNQGQVLIWRTRGADPLDPLHVCPKKLQSS